MPTLTDMETNAVNALTAQRERIGLTKGAGMLVRT